MDPIETLILNCNTATKLGQEQKSILDTLDVTIKKTEESIRLDLMNRIDQNLNQTIPVLHLDSLTSHTNINHLHSNYEDYHDIISTYIDPLLEHCSPMVLGIIKKLFTSSLLIQLNKHTVSNKSFSRQYLFTDQVDIFLIDLIINNVVVPYPELFPSIRSIYCVVVSKSTVNLKDIDFPSLSFYYQRQLTSCKISKHALNYLYKDFKRTYYHERWEL